MAFLPHLQESIMDELRTTEGMIFRNEGAKKLFLDTKSFVLETLSSAWSNFDTESYHAMLDKYLSWDEAVADEVLQRALTGYRDIGERLTSVTVLYAKYLYARAKPENNISIRKPRLETLLKGMFTRLARTHHIRNGAFFELDPLRQDFVVRDIFRQTLGTDCISIVEPDVCVQASELELDDAHQAANAEADADADVAAATAAEADAKQEESGGKPLAAQASVVAAEEQSASLAEEEVGPDDSISRVMERLPRPLWRSEGEREHEREAERRSVVASSTSRAGSRAPSEFHKPSAVRRVQITDTHEE